MKIITLFILLVLFNLIDAGTTTYFIHHFGVDAEVNPLMKWVIIQSGIIGMFVVKLLFIASFYVLYRFYQRNDRMIRGALTILCSVYGLLCIHNIYGVVLVYSTVGSV